jgi:hypothetical protein
MNDIDPQAGRTRPREHRRRSVAFSVGDWRVTYVANGERGPREARYRCGLLAGPSVLDPATGMIRVPVVDEPSAPVPHWVDNEDIIEVHPPGPAAR